MSAANTPPGKTRNWLALAFILSIAINGLLAGLVLSKVMTHKTQPRPVSMQQTPGGNPALSAAQNPRRLARQLSAERRKNVLETAVRNLDTPKEEHPRALFKELRSLKREIAKLSRAENVDAEAIRIKLVKVRELNDKLAAHSDRLVIEILKQLTPEERKKAFQRGPRQQGRNPNKKPKRAQPQ